MTKKSKLVKKGDSMVIRKAEMEDICAIKEIEREAFSKYLNIDFNRKTENIEIHIEICNGGVFVAEEESRINGFIYARALGKIGWIGTFAVKSDMQGKGVGSKLLQRAIGYLEDAGCDVIGLETLNTAYKNIEIYLKCGFKPLKPSFQLGRKVEKVLNHDYTSNFNEKAISKLADEILKGYNPSVVFNNSVKNNWGEIIELRNENCYGAALLEFLPKLEAEKRGTLTVNSLLINENVESKINKAIEVINWYAYEKGYDNIEYFVNAENDLILRELLKNGFKIKNSRIRMVLKGEYLPSGVECSRWIM